MNNRKLSLEEIKEIELNILKFVRNVCQENHLKYFLCGGTLLGAIRHKGFIPWDDDIDVLMPREDYRKLIEILKDNDKYRSISLYHNEDYYYSFAKVIDLSTDFIETQLQRPIKGYGVYIDIFPIDGLSKSKLGRNAHFNMVLLLRQLLYLSLNKSYPLSIYHLNSVPKYIVWRFATLVEWKRWIIIIERLATKFDFHHGDMAACIVAGYGKKELMHKAVFKKAISVEFEGEQFSAPVGFNEYLTNLYGNYMELLPEEKRISHHIFEAYLKYNSQSEQ